MITYRDCQRAFREIGLTDYSSVIVHYHPVMKGILGQSATFIQALLDVVSEGNVLAYTQYEDNSEPYRMNLESLDEAELVRKQLMDFDFKRYRDSYYDPLFMALSKTQGRLFSNHPHMVSCVNGSQSRYITRVQPLDFPFGKESSFGSMFELNSKILLIGDSFEECHELRQGYALNEMAPIQLNGSASGQGWEHYFDHHYRESDFVEAIKSCRQVTTIDFGAEKMRLIDYREALDKVASLSSKE